MIGQTISHYKIIEKLGEGGMGVVYKAQDTKLDRTVALKFLPPHLTQSKEDKRRFIREAKSAAALNHPNICTIHNIDEHEGRQFIVMEYIDGETLREKIDGGDLTLETVLDYGSNIADALSEAHEQDIFHRDIKPENIMVDAKGRLKVMDFGLAKLKQARDITKTGDTVGTLAYMSPEQIRGQQVDHRSDIFSLGIVLYEMLTGQKPFQGEHQAAMTYSIVNEEPEPLETYLPDAPEELTQIIDRLLAKDPEERIGNAGEVAELLGNVQESYDMLSGSSRPEQAGSEIKEPSSGSDSSTISITLPGLGFGKKKVGWKGLLASVTVMLALALFAGWWFFSGSAGKNKTTATPDGKKSEIANHSIAVLPFEVSGGGAEEWKDGMVTALNLNLDGAAGLRAISDRTIFAEWKQKGGSEDIGKQQALDIARNIGARYAVIGSAVQLGQDLRFGVEVLEVASSQRLGQVEVRGAPDSVTELTNKLTRRILGVLLERSEEAIPSVDLESITTESLPALKAFLAGERDFRAGKYEEAKADYETAIEHDSTFALAYMRLSWSQGWGSGNVDQPMRQAYRLSDQLPRRERRLVRARYIRIVEDNEAMSADSLRQLTMEYPDDPLVWNWFGEALYHGRVPPGWTGAEDAFGRAIELDPGQATYHHHYVELGFALHHDSTLAAERIKAHPIADRKKHHYRLALDLIFGNEKLKEKALRRFETVAVPDYSNFFVIFDHPFHWHLKDRLFPVLRNREDLEDIPSVLPFASYQQGHFGQAISEFKQRGLDPLPFIIDMNTLDVPIPDSIARQYLDPKSVLEEAYQYLEPKNFTDDVPLNELRSPIIYLNDKGRKEAADELINRVQEISDTTENKKHSSEIQSVLHEVRAYRAWKSGDLQEAEKLFSRSNEPSPPGPIWRGDLYREFGKLEQAKDWYLAAWQHPISHERLGRLYEQMDKPEKAADAYRRFIVAWKDADPELQDRVEQARQRLQQLSVSEKSTTEEVIDVEEQY